MSWGMIAGGTIAAAGGIGSALLSNSGGGDSSTMAAPRPTNPAMQQLNYIFGQPTYTRYSSRGNPIKSSGLWGPTGDTTFKRGKYAGQTFSGDVFGEDLKDSIAKYLENPRALIPGTDDSLWDSILGGGEGFNAGMEKFRSGMEAATGTARQLNDTGLLTDGSAYYDEALRKLRTEVAPDLAERSGLGTASSGFLGQNFNAGADLLGQAALANIDLQEAATNRRMQAAPLLSALLTAEQTTPLNIGTMLSSISDSERFGALNLYKSLFEMGSNQGSYIQPSVNPSSPGAGYSSALTGIGSILGGLGGFAGMGGGGGAGGGANFLSSLFSLGGPGY